jgi:hypothetical protein
MLFGIIAIDPKPHAFASLALQSNITEEVELFKGEEHMVPSGKQLRAEANNDPEKIRQISDKALMEVDETEKGLLEKIVNEKNNGNITSDEAQYLTDETKETAKLIKDTIKETSNVSVDLIDDTSVTEHLLYETFFPFVFTGLPVIR